MTKVRPKSQKYYEFLLINVKHALIEAQTYK